MPIGVIGRKRGMTRVFTDEGDSVPVTVIEVAPNAVLQVKTTEKDGYEVSIGTLTTYTELRHSPVVSARLQALSEMAATVGAAQIQNRGTLGGNIANASPAADTAPPLMSADAVVIVASTRGERRIPITKWFTGPGQTVLKDRELIRAIEIPSPAARSISLFDKLGWRINAANHTYDPLAQ